MHNDTNIRKDPLEGSRIFKFFPRSNLTFYNFESLGPELFAPF